MRGKKLNLLFFWQFPAGISRRWASTGLMRFQIGNESTRLGTGLSRSGAPRRRIKNIGSGGKLTD
jgi:hypothetical protein